MYFVIDFLTFIEMSVSELKKVAIIKKHTNKKRFKNYGKMLVSN